MTLRQSQCSIRFLSGAPRRNKLRLFRFFYFIKNQSPASLFLLSAKSHARFTYSVVNALATVRCRYQLFAVYYTAFILYDTNKEPALKRAAFYERLAGENCLISGFEPIAMQHSIPVRCNKNQTYINPLLLCYLQ